MSYRAYGAYRAYRAHRIITIQPKTQTAHVQMTFREMLYAGRITDVTKNLMVESLLKTATGTVELLELQA